MDHPYVCRRGNPYGNRELRGRCKSRRVHVFSVHLRCAVNPDRFCHIPFCSEFSYRYGNQRLLPREPVRRIHRDSLQVMVSLNGSSCQNVTGTVTVTLGSQTQTINLTPVGLPLGEGSMGLATFSNLQAGTYQLTGAYSGDSFYPAASSETYTVTVASSTDPLLPTTTAITESPSVVSYNGRTTLSVTVTTANGSKGPPTGYVNVYGDGGSFLWEVALASSGTNASTGSFLLQQVQNRNAFGPDIGVDQITAVYAEIATISCPSARPSSLMLYPRAYLQISSWLRRSARSRCSPAVQQPWPSTLLRKMNSAAQWP